MANCPGCGSILRFDISEQKLLCQSCGGKYNPYDIDNTNNAESSSDDYNVNVFACPNCGGELYSTDYDLSGNCSYCGSPVVFDIRMKNEKRPTYIIPFSKTKEDCKQSYLNAIRNCLFVPKELKNPDYIEGFRGIYVPYWLYEVELEGKPFEVEASYSYTKGEYDYKETYSLKGQNIGHFDEISHDASSVLSDDISECVEPYELRDSKRKSLLKEFTPSYFSGFYAEPADVPSENYEEYAQSLARERTKIYLDNDSPFAKYKISNKMNPENLETQVKNVDLAMFPIWFLSLRKGKRVSYAAVNGQTGRLISDLPVDMKSFFLTMVLVTAVLFIAMNFMTILPRTVTFLAVFISYITSSLCYDDINLLSQRDQIGPKKTRNQTINSKGTMITFIVFVCVALIAKFVIFMDDEMSFLSSHWIYAAISIVLIIVQLVRLLMIILSVDSMISQRYYGGIFPFLCLGASIYGTYTLIKNPFEDSYYYSVAIVVIAITLFSIIGLILNYNRVASRPLPQFKIHTGGDDRA